MTQQVNSHVVSAGDHLARRITPTFTLSEALRGKLTDRDTYKLTLPLHRMALTAMPANGSPCEPSEQVTNKLVAHYGAPIHRYLGAVSRRRLDPVIKTIEHKTSHIDMNLQILEAWDRKVRGEEAGVGYTEPEAVDHVARGNLRVSADEDQGMRHHRPVGLVLRWAGRLAPYLETAGIAVFAMFALNVEPLDPGANPMGWTLALVMVAVVLFGQPRFVERAAQGWNRRREAINEQQPVPTEQASHQLVSNGVVASLFALFITGGLVERYLATGDATDTVVYILMLFACGLTGLGMPLLDFIATAWDGSSVSRERDSLVAQLDANFVEYEGLRHGALALSRECDTLTAHARDHVVPEIVRGAEEIMAPVHDAYAWLRIQIGGLTAKPPYDRDPCLDTSDPLAPSFDTGIPGAPPLVLTALADRNTRLVNVNVRREEAMEGLAQVADHPWATRT